MKAAKTILFFLLTSVTGFAGVLNDTVPNPSLRVIQVSRYYPFGLSFNQYQADRLKETTPGNYAPELRNRYLFQGQALQKDLDLGWYQFKWRMHVWIAGYSGSRSDTITACNAFEKRSRSPACRSIYKIINSM